MAEIIGTEGSDLRIGSDSADQMFGLGGNDHLEGRGGNDTIDGGSGNDELLGGTGTDQLTGGTGADRFIGTMAELNGDLITDLAVGDRIQITDLSSANFAFLGNTITFGSGSSISVSALPPVRYVVRSMTEGFELRLQGVAQNDFNGDGKSDVLLRYQNNTLIDWLGQASGTFGSNHANATYSLDAAWQVAGTGDFNSDGRSDVMLRNSDGTLTEWLGQANGSFNWNAAATYGLNPGWTVAGTGDFNGDNNADVLLRYTNGTVINWLGQDDGTFFSNHAATTYALPTEWKVAGTGDFNGDGRSDVLLRNDNGSITEWLAEENGGFSWNAAANYGVNAGWNVVGTGDFNGDGNDDVLLRFTNGTIIDWLGQGDGTFLSNHANATYALDPSWTVAQVGDFNGDARDDVLLQNTNGTITEWLGETNGGFSWNANATYGVDSHWLVQ